MPLTKVSSGVIAANAVVDSFGTQSITGDKLGLTAINANNIVGGAVTGDKIGATSINANNIVNASITGAKIALGTITGDDIATGQITGNLLTANCVSGNNIVSSPTITGNVTINGSLGIGGAAPASSGFGITFPATQSASSDANTLDDYEEGTFTATITSGLTSPTYNNQAGRYVKIGRMCYFQLVINVTGGTRNSNILAVSLPLTSANTGTFAGGAYFSYVTSSIVNSTTTNLPTLYIGGNSAEINFYNTLGGSFVGNDLNNATPQFYIVGWFEAA